MGSVNIRRSKSALGLLVGLNGKVGMDQYVCTRAASGSMLVALSEGIHQGDGYLNCS